MTTTDGFSELYTGNEKPDADIINEEESILPKVIQHRVFINHVDSFCSKHLASVKYYKRNIFSDCIHFQN